MSRIFMLYWLIFVTKSAFKLRLDALILGTNSLRLWMTNSDFRFPEG